VCVGDGVKLIEEYKLEDIDPIQPFPKHSVFGSLSKESSAGPSNPPAVTWSRTMPLQRDKLGSWDRTHLRARVGFSLGTDRVEEQGAGWFGSAPSDMEHSLSLIL